MSLLVALVASATAIVGGTVIDGTGAPPLAANVVIEDGRVASMGGAPPAGARVVDARGLYLIPALVDAHAHVTIGRAPRAGHRHHRRGDRRGAPRAGGAEALGIAGRTGTIAAGKDADLVLLEANPLDDIRNTRRIREVWQRGAPVRAGCPQR